MVNPDEDYDLQYDDDMISNELNMIRRDNEIDMYNDWWQDNGKFAESLQYDNLLSWRQWDQYCIKCGQFARTTQSSREGYESHQDPNDYLHITHTHGCYKLECGHYVPKENYEGLVWDDEVGWVVRGDCNYYN